MIYYPLSTLMQADLREIMIITTPQDQAAFQKLLGNGHQLGIDIQWAEQEKPNGLAEAFIIAEDFLDGAPSALILGDNLFFGDSFFSVISQVARDDKSPATIFGYEVNNPTAYGVVGFDDHGRAISLEEKPETPTSNYAVTGLYFYDEHAPAYARQVKPSARRGELEITDLSRIYLDRGELDVVLLESGTTWLDTGTHHSLLKASQFVSVIEERQGRRICCPEAIAYQKKWITADELSALAKPLEDSGYGKYLNKLIESKS